MEEVRDEAKRLAESLDLLLYYDKEELKRNNRQEAIEKDILKDIKKDLRKECKKAFNKVLNIMYPYNVPISVDTIRGR